MDYKTLGAKAAEGEVQERAVVPNRVVQYDSDFACYETADLDISLSENIANLKDFIETKRVLAGAERVNVHLTLGSKSGREQIATIAPYQDNRDPDAPIKVRVRQLRSALSSLGSLHMGKVVGSLNHEADDTMVAMQHEDLENSVIMSGDKDLWMAKGWHCCPKTGRMWYVDGYGKTEYREVGNVKPKLVGEGTSWFWHQMLMGDTADNIKGLPRLCNSIMDEIQPLKSGKPRKAGDVACGEAKAYALLKDVDNDKRAADIVYEAYSRTYNNKAQEMFVENAFLLWMRRNKNEWDCIDYLAECNIYVDPTVAQIKAVQEWKDGFTNHPNFW